MLLSTLLSIDNNRNMDLGLLKFLSFLKLSTPSSGDKEGLIGINIFLFFFVCKKD